METLDLLNGLDLHKVDHASIVLISCYLTTGCGPLNIQTGEKKNSFSVTSSYFSCISLQVYVSDITKY